MRLTISFLGAIALHGALLGAAVVLSHAPSKAETPAAIEVDVEVTAPRPDPIDDATPPAVAPKSRVTRHVREVAFIDNPTSVSALAEPSSDVDAPTISPAHSPSSTPTTALRGSTAAAQSGGAVVTARPRYHTNPKPDYPIPSLRRREEGIVLLNVQVQPDGTPAAISLNKSCSHPLLDRAALDAVRRWTFEPARAGGIPVSSLVVIPVRFSLADEP